MNEPDILQRLSAAAANPTAPASNALMDRLLPCLRVAGAKTPFGPVERAESISKLHALV